MTQILVLDEFNFEKISFLSPMFCFVRVIVSLFHNYKYSYVGFNEEAALILNIFTSPRGFCTSLFKCSALHCYEGLVQYLLHFVETILYMEVFS